MDNQEAFNRIVTHLRKQGSRALDDTGGCRYRTPEGKRCAVGVLLTDEMYLPSFEGTGIWGNNLLLATLKTFYPNIKPELLGTLQAIHDGEDPCIWETAFQQIADKYSLTMPPESTTVSTEEFKELSDYKPVAVEVH